MLSKSERGFGLADGGEPNSFKAEPIALRPNLSVAQAFQIIARACVRHFRINEPLLIASRSAEPLHQARVAIRRLRSALSLFEPIVTDNINQRLKRSLRDVSHQFGEARNLDVYITQIKVRDADEGGQLPPFALNPVTQAQTERERASISNSSKGRHHPPQQFVLPPKKRLRLRSGLTQGILGTEE